MDRRTLVGGAAALAALGAGEALAQPRLPEGGPRPRLRMIRSNGIRMRIAEMGKGPLVVLVHGWPESWYSWRHQIPAIAAAGYRVVAPDMRGYGRTDKPAAVEDYDIKHTTGDNGGRGAAGPLAGMRRTYGDNFYYILYHNEPGGVAEKEYDSDPRGILSRLYTSPDTPLDPPTVTDPKRSAGGWIPRLGKPKALPSWLRKEDLDYYVSEFSKAGFRGGVNYYRNMDRNWEITPDLTGKTIPQPVTFIAGSGDIVIRGATADSLTTQMRRVSTDFRGVTLLPGAGHWVQQERAAEVNTAILTFLRGLPKTGA